MNYFENLVAIGVIAMTKKSMKTVVIKKRDRRGCECDSNLRGEKIRRFFLENLPKWFRLNGYAVAGLST